MFASVLVANRGEIARRVIRTLHAARHPLGRDLHRRRRAARRTCARPTRRCACRLLPGDRARSSAAPARDALHPGYGFLSENPAFARACARGGRRVRRPAAGGDRADGRQGAGQGGGGARRRAGRRVADASRRRASRTPTRCWSRPRRAAAGAACASSSAPEELDEAIAAAQREAKAGFGDDRVFIERFLPRARHIEVQVIGDTHGTVLSLGERECSLQRRHQKVVEESPSPVVVAGAARARWARRRSRWRRPRATPAPARSSSSPTPTIRRRTSSSR